MFPSGFLFKTGGDTGCLGLTVGQDDPRPGTFPGRLKSSFNQEHEHLLSISEVALCVCPVGQSPVGRRGEEAFQGPRRYVTCAQRG